MLWCACRAGLFISWVFPEIFSPSWVFPLVFSLGGVGLTLLNLSLGPQLMLAFFLLCDVGGVLIFIDSRGVHRRLYRS